jgi:hypothetical protein
MIAQRCSRVCPGLDRAEGMLDRFAPARYRHEPPRPQPKKGQCGNKRQNVLRSTWGLTSSRPARRHVNRRRTLTFLDLVPSIWHGVRICHFQRTRSASKCVTPPVSLKPIVDQSLGLMSSGVTVRRQFTAGAFDLRDTTHPVTNPTMIEGLTRFLRRLDAAR